MEPIYNTEDVIDSRDVIERIEELEGADGGGYPLDEAEADELKALKALAERGMDYCDWGYGATLVRDSFFTQYAQQLAEDVGAVLEDAGWPTRCIDWEQAARELQMDYTCFDFDGITYWVR